MSTPTEKTLLISCHSAGMGSILQGAAAGLLYAELTGRTPLIHWNTHCKYLSHSAHSNSNAFTQFYEGTSDVTLLECLEQANLTYPNNLTSNTLPSLLQERLTNFNEIESEAAQQADALLFPAYVPIETVIDHAPESHSISNLNIESAAEWAAEKYLHVSQELQSKVQNFWESHFEKDTPVVTVHIRGGDKYQEAIMPAFSRYTDAADQFIQKHPDAKVFLASDSTQAVAYFQKHYKERLVTTPAFRSTGRKGVHKSGEDGQKIGNEIVFDVECLSKGQHFIGYKESNVYFWVCHLTMNGISKQFTDLSVQSGRKELFLNRQNFKRTVKAKWKGLFSK